MSNSDGKTCFRGCCSSSTIPLAIIPKPSLTLVSEIARGAESVVYKGTLHGNQIAAKKPRLSTSEDIIGNYSKLEHPNIVKLVTANAQPPDYMFIFPFYDQGNLSHALHIREWLPSWKDFTKISLQLASALRYLHSIGIIHRDIKPANILLDSEWNAYLGDFGLAMPLDDVKGISSENWKSIGKPTGGFHKKNMVGTLLYMAPEVLRKEVHTEKSDVYGFAITIKPVLAGSDCGIPARLSQLIECCWNNDSTLRPSFIEVVSELEKIISSSNMFEDKRNMVGESNSHENKIENVGSEWPKQTIHKDYPLSNLSTKWLKSLTVEAQYIPTLSWGYFSTCGGRESMEDAHFLYPKLGGANQVHLFGVLDGHRGEKAAEYASNTIPYNVIARSSTEHSLSEALTAAFTETDIAFRKELDLQRPKREGQGKNWHPGCTAAAALFVNEMLYVANAGDCRTVLCRNGKAIPLSEDHTASCVSERERVIKEGGQVSWQVDTWRVGAAALQVTSSIGDDDLKPAVTAIPEVTEIALTEDDEFLIIASDGLWDKVTNDEAVSFVKNTVKEPSMSSKRLATEAVERGSRDNITVIIIFLHPVSTLERVY